MLKVRQRRAPNLVLAGVVIFDADALKGDVGRIGQPRYIVRPAHSVKTVPSPMDSVCRATLLFWNENSTVCCPVQCPRARVGTGSLCVRRSLLGYRDNATAPTVVFWNHGRQGLVDEVSLVAATFTKFVDALY